MGRFGGRGGGVGGWCGEGGGGRTMNVKEGVAGEGGTKDKTNVCGRDLSKKAVVASSRRRLMAVAAPPSARARLLCLWGGGGGGAQRGRCTPANL